MISQADIIRILVNKNCTDEAIISMALSPECTPRKLLEKFTEAERFDLALDFSMKLGLDVFPLWKTWAMRCLKNRDFQGAREKFRHCFLRIKTPLSGCMPRKNTSLNPLLDEILHELEDMDEKKLSLTEEIESIKSGGNRTLDMAHVAIGRLIINSEATPADRLDCKPTIHEECMYYLSQYGCTIDCVKFYAQNYLWQRAIKILIENRNQINANFYINDIMLYAAAIGQLDQLLKAFLELDPKIVLSVNYFHYMYNFCTTHARYNTLYYIQTSIGDLLAAAGNQINNIYLKKPTQMYKELWARLSSLNIARQNYQNYLDAKKQDADDDILATDSFVSGRESNLFTDMTIGEIESRLRTIDLQTDITRNFALNEVSGLVITEVVGHKPDDVSDLDSPVTLFDKSERRLTFLAALVLIYYDPDCRCSFSSAGLNLTNRLTSNYKLDKLKIFKTAMRIVIEDESCDITQNATLLLERLLEDFNSSARKIQAEHRKRTTNVRLGLAILTSPSATSAFSQSPNSLAVSTTPTSSSPSSTSFIRAGHASDATYMRQLASKGHNDATQAQKSTITLPTDYKSTSPLSTANTVADAAKMICDEVILDAISSCREADYKLNLAKLLSNKSRIEIYLELGQLSSAQSLAFEMSQADYVYRIMEKAEKLNQNHVRTLCQLWLAKHEK